MAINELTTYYKNQLTKNKPSLLVPLFLYMFLTVSLYGFQQAGYQYISPMQDAVYVPPQTTIIFRLTDESPAHISNLTACVTTTGSASGTHACRTFVASDDRTVISEPELPFSPGEKVTVRISPEFESFIDPPILPFEYVFNVSESSTLLKMHGDEKIDAVNSPSPLLKKSSTGSAKIFPNGVSVPGNFPEFDITLSDNPANGTLFLNTIAKENFTMILDNSGNPLWYQNTPWPRLDFKVQHNGLLTMHVQKEEGRHFGSGFIGLDNTFTVVDSFYARHGYSTDYHDLQLLENGHYLLIGTREEKVDLSEHFPGGYPYATVRESVIQEFTEKGELIFQWRAWDHFDIADLEIEDVHLPSIRFPHMNAIDIDDDGHILLSSRHLSEITKINRHTGDIIWRFGGAHNQFTLVNDPSGFSGQHDIRALGNNRYTLFDNGNLHQPSISRAVEYVLNTTKMTATLVWEFRDTPDKYAAWMGNAQRLPNGNTLINWAHRLHPAKPVEVNPDGNKVFEMTFVDQLTCYRIFRFNWQGAAKKPYLIAESRDDNVTLLFNTFGNTNVDYYRIYAGETPHPTALLDTAKLTMKSFVDFTNRRTYYFRVTAVHSDGHESDFSNEESAFVNFTAPEKNMLLNADFADGSNYWGLKLSDALAGGSVNEDEQFHVDIQKGGSDYHNVQLHQGYLKLVKGKNYVFEFDAYAEEDRLIEAYVTKVGHPDVNFGKIGLTFLKKRMQHFVYPFKMRHANDFNAVVVFNVGSSDVDVYIDNVSLKQDVESLVADPQKRIVQEFRLYQNYPNPFNLETKITYSLADRADVSLNIYNVAGRHVRTLVKKTQRPGAHSAAWDSRDQAGVVEPSGIYFCRLDIKHSAGHFTETKKITLVK